ncbi:MAG: hypothetical protein JW717_13625 [Marinilabiliaceae bacterium]|nr:hypothetical protein [Marinilabiliaceae bacterium]
MRKLLFISILLSTFLSLSQAQVMKKGDNAFNFGLGIPNVEGNIKMPAIIAAYDHGFSEKLGIGYISGGAQLSFSSGGDEYWGVKYRNTYFVIGPRAAYHFDFVDITGNSAFEKFDIYAGIFAGFSFESYKTEYTSYNETGSKTNFREDLFIGARYSFADNLAVYAESGYGIAYLSAGISFKY